MTSLFHPDKEEPSVTSLESLTNKSNEENINNETYSISTRNRSGSAGSDRTSSAPPSPMKEVRSPEFPSVTPGNLFTFMSSYFTASQKIKKSPGKKNLLNQINQFHEIFIDQNPFLAISKMAKNQFLNWEKVYIPPKI